MRGIILAAGRGVRMGKLTNGKPKCLIKYKGKRLLEHQIDCFRRSNINDIAIVTGYKREMLSRFKLKEFNNPKWEETNMVSSLLCANEYLENYHCIVSYSDILYSHNAIKMLMNLKHDIAITYDPNWLSMWSKRFEDPLVDAETFKIDKSTNLIFEIGKKPNKVSEIQGQYMGLIYIKPRGWIKLKKVVHTLEKSHVKNLSMTELLQIGISNNLIFLYGCPYYEEWAEFDSITDLNF